jgi:putative SOS response-associated peptidase YedK
MCGRFTLSTSAKDLASLFDGLNVGDFKARYNICPTQPVLSVRLLNGQLQSDDLRWGLVPSWSKDLKIGARMINARSETIAEKPSFRSAFKKRRCLVLTDGFYEWKTSAAGKQPHFISLASGEPFAMAGLWESWQNTSGGRQVYETCTVVTQPANSFMKTLHDRMPVILSPAGGNEWLGEAVDKDALPDWLTVVNREVDLQAWPVSTLVNKPANDGPECVEPANEFQKGLFD